PHVIVKNRIGKIGKFSGCIFSKLNSGIFAPFPDVNNVIPTATVPITKIAPKIGYILPIILSIGKIVDKKKYRNIMTKIINKAILPSNKTCRYDHDFVSNKVSINHICNIIYTFNKCL